MAAPPSSPTRVFLSYLYEDSQVADRLRFGLVQAKRGIQFVDIGPHTTETLVEGIRSADVVLVLASGAANTAELLDEVGTLAGTVAPVIPVTLGSLIVHLPKLSGYPAAPLRGPTWDADIESLADQILNVAALGDVRFRAPSSLPPPPRRFFDRTDLVKMIEVVLTAPDVGRTSIVQIAGPPGIGKTALVLHVAHRFADRFPDGQLYAQLGTKSSVLRRFLEAMGVTEEAMPSSTSALETLYRRMIAERRLLVVLDDATNVDEVAALLPRGGGSAALITARAPLTELTPAADLEIDLREGLPKEYALDLLRATAGSPFVDEDPKRALELIEAVEGSPLALSLIGAQTRQHGAGSLGALTAGLRALPDGAARQVLLERVYQALPAGERRLFRLFGAVPAQEFEPGLVAALAGTELDKIGALLDSLTEAVLIERATAGGYRMSDLVSRFAAERLVADEPEHSRQAALGRAVRWMTAKMSIRQETPITRDFWTTEDKLGYSTYADAIASFIRHRGTLPPLTIGITAPWGAGKTSLMRMVQQRLDQAKQLRFSDDARKTLARGVKSGTADQPVTNLELLRNTSEPSEVEVSDLDVQTPENDWRPTIWFNPWMYQSGEQVWAGLAYEIITQITDRLPAGDRERFWLALNLRRLDRQAVRRRIYRQIVDQFLPWLLGVVVAIVIAMVGVSVALIFPSAVDRLRVVFGGLTTLSLVVSAGGAFRALLRFLRSRASGSFGPLLHVPNPVKGAAGPAKGTFAEMFRDPAYETRLGFLHLVHTDMRRALDLVATPKRPLVVFVDDLDRCSPSTVVQVIEAINLFLAGEFPNCVFVLAMEPAVVAAHVEAVYKDLAARPVMGETATLGWRFLEKIVQLPLSLPPPAAARQVDYLDSLLKPPERRVTTATSVVEGRGTVTAQAEVLPTGEVAGEAASGADPVPRDVGQTGEDRVRQIELAIRVRTPTLETLASAALEAQAEVVEGATGTLLPETSEAANRVLIDLYSDGEARTAILAGVPGLASDNPREIKRFVNLFRFYTFIAQQQQLQGQRVVSGAEIAKLSVLAIRWPHLVGALVRRAGPSTMLSRLEASLREEGDGWGTTLRDAGLTAAGEDAVAPAWAAHLREFLATHPPIAAAADRIL